MDKKQLEEIKTRSRYAEYWPNLIDSTFIHNARQDVPDLLAYVDELEERLDDLESHFAPIVATHPQFLPKGWSVEDNA